MITNKSAQADKGRDNTLEQYEIMDYVKNKKLNSYFETSVFASKDLNMFK